MWLHIALKLNWMASKCDVTANKVHICGVLFVCLFSVLYWCWLDVVNDLKDVEGHSSKNQVCKYVADAAAADDDVMWL